MSSSGGEGGGGGGALAVRGSDVTAINSNTHNFILPVGTTAGDFMVLFAGHGWGATNPTGWTVLYNSTGLNWNGGAWTKVLDATDISNGFVTIGFEGSFNGIVAGIVFEGGTGGVRASNASRNSTDSATRVVSVPALNGAEINDYFVCFGSKRQNGVVSCDIGTELDVVASTNASGVLTGDITLVGGQIDATFGYPTGASGDFQAVIIIQPAA